MLNFLLALKNVFWASKPQAATKRPKIDLMDDSPQPLYPDVIELSEPAYRLSLLLRENPNDCLLRVGLNSNGLYYQNPKQLPAIPHLLENLGLENPFGQERLLPKTWLNDNCIKRFGDKLACLYEDFKMLDSLEMSEHQLDKRIKSKKHKVKVGKEDLQAKNKLAYGFSTGDHWFAIMMDLTDKKNIKIFCTDSLNQVQSHAKILQTAKKYLGWLHPEVKRIQTQSLKIPHQGNPYDCGVAVGLIIELFAKGALKKDNIRLLANQDGFDYGLFRTHMATLLAMDEPGLKKLNAL